MSSFSLVSSVAFVGALALGSLGCGTTYSPARSAAFELEPPARIDDADIEKAFEARPQMPAQVRVAYYTFDPQIAKDLDASLGRLPGVVSAYRIPPLLVNGQRRVDAERPWATPREVTVKQLRLLAARAHADVLIIVDHGYRTGGANGLAALNLLLVPILFAPFIDSTIDGYAEGYVVDVRNGYLYGHVSEDDRRGKPFATIYDRSPHELAKEQWSALGRSLSNDLAALLTSARGASGGVVKAAALAP